MDLSLGAFVSTPERFWFCASIHPRAGLEVDSCLGGADRLGTFAAHATFRAEWARGPWAFGLGPSLGARVMDYCNFGRCAASAGPELLLSAELVYWLRPGLGVTLQAEGGVTLFFSELVAGIVQHGYRAPGLVTLGIAL
jgi:hypothetical protein